MPDPKLTDSTILIGQAGNLRVRSELLLRGIPTAVADVDDGTDVLLVRSGRTIQVKTSLKPRAQKGSGCKGYCFDLRFSKFRKGKSGVYKQLRRSRYTVDFFVLWCVEDSAFYVLPGSEVGSRIHITITSADFGGVSPRIKGTWKNVATKYAKYKNAWHLLRDL